MRKKALIISVAVIALVAFGTVSSAHAFIEPVSMSVILLGTGFFALATAAKAVYHSKSEPAQKNVKQLEAKQKTGAASRASGPAAQLAVETGK